MIVPLHSRSDCIAVKKKEIKISTKYQTKRKNKAASNYINKNGIRYEPNVPDASSK